jgi:Tol biopolymer transport system component
MNSRSSIVVLAAAAAACMLIAVCGALLAGGYWFFFTPGGLTALTTPPPVNRVVFVGNDSNIYVSDPTSGTTTAVTHDGGKQHAYNYPAWSPDSRRLAFVGYTLDGENLSEGSLFTAAPSGDKLTPVYKAPDHFPFYLYWSPDSQHVAFLADKEAGRLALNVAQTDAPDSTKELDTGAPLYWAWAPDSSQMFTHVGGTRADNSDARLALLPFGSNQSRHALDALPGSFQAPQWASSGSILYSAQDGDKQVIALSDAQGKETKKLVEYKGRASFALAPDGKMVAYLLTDAATQLPHFGPLRVVNVQDGKIHVVSQSPVLAFLWSPNSQKLAYLTVTLGNNSSPEGPTNFDVPSVQPEVASREPEKFSNAPSFNQSGQPRVQLHWQVWDSVAGGTRTVASFVPTTSFLNVIPYFDQYANSSTFWSPDSQFLVYTARTDERGDVWIADATGANPPRKIGEGVIAFWSWR